MVELWNRWWNSRTCDGGTVEHVMVEQLNGYGATGEHLMVERGKIMVEQWNRDGGTVEHVMVQQLNNRGGTVEVR